MNSSSPELLGFFVYELRVGHDERRSCAPRAASEGLFAWPACGIPRHRYAAGQPVRRPGARIEPLRYTGAGRPQRSRSPAKKTAIYALLYVQVLQVDGLSWRDILLLRAEGSLLAPQALVDGANFLPALAVPPGGHSGRAAVSLGLPLDSPLSVVVLEMLPENSGRSDRSCPPPALSPVGAGLGQVRILRASTLTPVPQCRPRCRL